MKRDLLSCITHHQGRRSDRNLRVLLKVPKVNGLAPSFLELKHRRLLCLICDDAWDEGFGHHLQHAALDFVLVTVPVLKCASAAGSTADGRADE